MELARCTRRALGMAAVAAWLAPAAAHGASRWRRDFPLLDRRLAYLDSAATTQRPRAVIDSLVDFYERDNANPGAALHALARRAHERYESARRTVAEFINAIQPEEIIWTRGTTEAINLVATAWAGSELRPGDEVLLTLAEHASNLLPWRLAAERAGARVLHVGVDDAGRIDLEDLDRKLSARTRLFAFSHVSNVTGYINPASEICARARRAGSLVLVDAAQSVPHVAVDVQALGCDFLAFSGHKMLGPMGIGVLWARSELLERMRPYQAGSNMAHAVDLHAQHFERAARKFGAGTPNVCGPVGLAAAIRYLKSVGRGAIEQHERALVSHGLDRLGAIPGLRLLGPLEARDRLPVFSFTLNDRAPLEVLSYLDSHEIAVRAGDLSALPLLRRLGATGAVRASCYLYTQSEELDRLADALERRSA
jgi:cysteine desulfurase/selenocysteine lyase